LFFTCVVVYICAQRFATLRWRENRARSIFGLTKI
jgi:hypothetical protein